LVPALQKMLKAATNPELQAAFEKHRNETRANVARLEQVFELLGEKPAANTCDALKGLIEEAQSSRGGMIKIFSISKH
jgi:ferritin-like metal-binding protein YciE